MSLHDERRNLRNISTAFANQQNIIFTSKKCKVFYYQFIKEYKNNIAIINLPMVR